MKQKLLLLLLACALLESRAQTPPAMVKDIYVGNMDGCENDYYLDELNGKAYFFASPNDSTLWLYSSDGTDAGTTPVTKARAYNYNEPRFRKWNNRLIWTGNDGNSWDNNHLMITDGTAAGTKSILQVNATDAVNSWIGDGFIPMPNGFFMTLYDSSTTAVFYSDGTAAGTKKVFSTTGFINYIYDLYCVVNSKLVFSVNNDIYVADGTPGGTQLLYSPSVFTKPGKGMLMGNYVYFGYDDELWRTDGTVAGTTLVKGGYDSEIEVLAVAGNKVFFRTGENGSGTELFVSDGTNAGTQLVKDIEPSGSGLTATHALMGIIGNKIIFVGNTVAGGTEAWVSDGTSAGTFMLKDICTGSGSAYIDAPATDAVNSVVYFLAEQCGQAQQLYRTDGTTAGTYEVNNTNIGTTAFTPLEVIDGLVYYSTIASGIGHEMFVTNGLPGGTIHYDLVPGAGYSNSYNFTKVGSKIFFKASDSHGEELWSSNVPVISGVNEPAANLPLLISPNPASDYIAITSANKVETVTIYNISGQQVLRTTNTAKIDVSQLLPGTYVVEALVDGNRVRRQLIKM